jgi:hypothetical protein
MPAQLTAMIEAQETPHGAAALLALLTRLANCGLNAEAPPLLHTSSTESPNA